MIKRYYLIDEEKLLIWLACFFLVLHAFSQGLQTKIFRSPIVAPILFAVTICIFLSKCNKKIYFKDIVVVLILFVISFFNNANFSHNQYIHIYYYTVGLFFVYIVACKREDWIDVIFKMLYFVGCFYALMTYITFIFPPFFYRVVVPIFSGSGYMEKMISLYSQGYMTGFAPHYSTNASYLALTLIVPLMGILTNPNQKRNKDVFIAIMIFVAILLTGKRAHSIFSLIAIILTYFIINPNLDFKKWAKLLGVIIAGIVMLLILSRFVPQILNVVNRFIDSAEKGDIELGRGVQRALALFLWTKSPIFGIGWDAYKYTFLDLTGNLINVHNVYIQLLCEVGIVGCIPFAIFFITSIVNGIRVARYVYFNCEDNGTTMRKIVFALYEQLFFLIYCFTGNPLYDEPTLFMYLSGCAVSDYYFYKLIKGA